jgi:hypothetical protein
LKVSIQICKGKEVRQGTISLSNASNFEHVMLRLMEVGWQVVEATTAHLDGDRPCGPNQVYELSQ